MPSTSLQAAEKALPPAAGARLDIRVAHPRLQQAKASWLLALFSCLEGGQGPTPWRNGAPWCLFGEPRSAALAGRSWSSESSAFLGPVTNMENMIQFIPSAEKTPGVERGWGLRS